MMYNFDMRVKTIGRLNCSILMQNEKKSLLNRSFPSTFTNNLFFKKSGSVQICKTNHGVSLFVEKSK